MKKFAPYLVILFIAVTILSSFKKNEQKIETYPSEFELLVQYLEENGNFINSELAPAIITASEIKENVKNNKYLVLDIRSESWFDYGHIKNAKNVKGPELLNYFENEIDPATFDKITVVCYSGQSAAYYASLLRLSGYNNAYSLKWGMSSWGDEFATNIWVKNSTNNFTDQLETISNPIAEKGETPTILTGKINGKEILTERIKEAFAKPYKEFIVKAEDAFTNPSDYYIVNYMDEEKYNLGHIKGAINYQPRTSLTTTSNLYTLPTNKKVLVNCLTGQSAAYTVAYLNVLGYDVANLGYGSNSYMNTLLTEKGWEGFSPVEIQNYPVVE
ncbi:rhodanese-like domain-containing protein [Lutibacter flavus]|uniref:Rhodanese-related sulfurtransferase n=1 Tax=Lutibacter flavus TaxID=691689 RepID=A0A238V898_9FLAO|nr:rhodanese-like domain-containing protein [Lutibacter flavus]SNR30438.1 Rhodanese-related sulfurtransferase [Lutibacter flavus]